MTKPILFALSALLFLACQQRKKDTKQVVVEQPKVLAICQVADSTKVQAVLDRLNEQSDQSTANLVAAAGKEFLGIPYVAHTLEHGLEEPLTIEVEGLDCTTFVETALALAKTAKAQTSNFNQFAQELEKIRYRDGKRDGYLSRLHYFTDWLFDNEQKGLITQPAKDFGKPLPVKVDFMSTHPDNYAILKANPELVKTMAEQEAKVSGRDYFYLPKTEFAANEDQLNEGDIIGLVTNIKGLDVTHTGILVRIEGRIHLMHASSLANEVVISEEPLDEMLQNKASYTGIVIARPLN